MTRTLALDPGTTCCGWAVGDGVVVLDCGLLRAKNLDFMTLEVQTLIRKEDPDVVLVEEPRVNRQFLQAKEAVVKLAMIVGAASLEAAVIGATCVRKKPRDWKGTVPGDVMTERIKTRLSGDEAKLAKKQLVPHHLAHNGYDAIGMLLALYRRL